jgi:hypothetical protein
VERVIVTIVGKQGSGKTTKLKPLVARCRRALFVDPEGKWEPQQSGDVVVRSANALLDHLGNIGATDPAIPFRVIYRGEKAERMADVAGRVAFGVRNLSLVIDELAWMMSAQRVPEYLAYCVQFGRERYINLVGTTRQPQEIANMFFDQADVVFMFRTQPGLGLDRLKRWYPTQASELPNLKLHEYRAYGDERCAALLGHEGLARSRTMR